MRWVRAVVVVAMGAAMVGGTLACSDGGGELGQIATGGGQEPTGPGPSEPAPSVSSTAPPVTTPAAPLAPGESTSFELPTDLVATFHPRLVGDRILIPVEGGLASFGPTGVHEWTAETCPYLQRWADQLSVTAGPIVTLTCNDQLFAVDSADGRVLWDRRIHEQSFRDAPGDETAIVVESSDGIEVLDPATGETRFERTFTSDVSRSDIADGRVIVGDDDRVVALDAMTGAELWSVDTDMGLLIVEDGTVYVVTGSHIITALDAATGAKRWDSQPDPRQQSSVLFGVAGGRLILKTGQDLVIAYDTTTGEPVWSFNDEDAGKVTVTPADGLVIVGRSQQHHIIDAATGTVVRVDDGSGARVGPGTGRYVDSVGSALVTHSLG